MLIAFSLLYFRGNLPAGAAMIPSLKPEQADFLRSFLLPRYEKEAATTKSVIEAIPPDKGDYRPDPFAKSALELAWHIAAAERRFLEGIVNGGLDFAPMSRPDSLRNSADIARWYGEMSSRLLPQIQQLSLEQLSKLLDFRGMFQLSAVSFLQMAMSHSVHHRGQLSTYLRPMGGKVPAIYGESYDSAEARKAAEGKRT
jgi:uncharacterized damage-inducible protein DinB